MLSSHISVSNQYACDLHVVGLSVNIQCANDRELPAASSLGMVVDYPLNQIGNHTFVEAQIRNVTKLALFVDSIKFMPLPPFAAGKQPGADRSPWSLLNPQEKL
ncbi:hypothetical protein PybrP1_010574 [[Pythium] brassicae (nom. inval.)]|nr:hypothetical protein PybrP1_010574 [[Pythium] brassicae (nom. inval.)]